MMEGSETPGKVDKPKIKSSLLSGERSRLNSPTDFPHPKKHESIRFSFMQGDDPLPGVRMASLQGGSPLERRPLGKPEVRTTGSRPEGTEGISTSAETAKNKLLEVLEQALKEEKEKSE